MMNLIISDIPIVRHQSFNTYVLYYSNPEAYNITQLD